MSNLIIRPGWHIPERFVTAEEAVLNRRSFLKQLGITGAALLAGCSDPGARDSAGAYPAPRNREFDPGWRLTNEGKAGRYNNFYEFSTGKGGVRKAVEGFQISPWAVEIGGLVQHPLTLQVRELVEMFPLEERVYRFRCVEAWAMIVPWIGFPLRNLVEKVVPQPEARFVRFESFNRPDEAAGMRAPGNYPWPYFEGLRLDEAMHPLTLVVTGIYGKPLPKQHGAPVRIVVPWKYGYKSIKSIVKIEFVRENPSSFWETVAPAEYPFESNVDPRVPHPRWSQVIEKMIDTGNHARTQLYNGYGDYVAQLYPKA